MRNTWDSLTEELDPLAGETLAECERQAGDVAAGASEARHHALGDKITHAEKDDGNRRRRALRRQRSRRDSVTTVDVVLDTVGGDTQQRSLRVLKPGGILVSVVSPVPE